MVGRPGSSRPASKQHARARGGGTAEARTRPNVEVNRRAEGTSELNRRLGAVEKGAAALERCGAAGDYGRGGGGRQAKDAARTIPRRPSSRPATRKRSRSAMRWSWETQPRPNVEVNRRAEGTSELNRRLGAVEKGAAALERCGADGDYGWGCGGTQALWHCREGGGHTVEQQACNRVASPESEEVEQQEPERGLTLRLTGAPKARPS